MVGENSNLMELGCQCNMFKNKNKMEFSKKLLLQESLLLWVVTLAFIVLAFICVINQSFGELPWLTSMALAPWGAYAVGQGFYYRKAEKENTQGGIKYDSIMTELKNKYTIPEIFQTDETQDSEDEAMG